MLGLLPGASSAQAATNFTVLRPFGFPERSGSYPRAGVILGHDNALYGTTTQGGSNDCGTVFKVNNDGSNYKVLWSFTRNGAEGRHPFSALIEDHMGGGGQFYGVTAQGSEGGGTVFRISSSGDDLHVLHTFATNGVDGLSPFGSLVQGSDDVLYGVTISGGTNDMGTVFKVRTDGTGYSVLRRFTGSGGDGRSPEAGLVEGLDGALYGVTSYGGSNDVGTVFRIDKNGSNYAVLRSFSSTGGDGQIPRAALMQHSVSHVLYGTTYSGGASNAGTLFKIRTNGTDYAVLKSFGSGAGDGAAPWDTLVEGDDTELYGTSYMGGEHGYGTIFHISAGGGDYSVLWSFDIAEGHYPQSCLTSSGFGGTLYVYGTTDAGGSNDHGTVFRYQEYGWGGRGLDTLWRFDPIGGDGGNSQAGLVEGSQGTLYGTTRDGGSLGYGTLFQIGKDGAGYALLQNFTITNGARPQSVLIEASDGALYGTTEFGGTTGGGTVFKFATNGSGCTILRHLGGGTDGYSPQAGVIEGKSDGSLYGTCLRGGVNGGGTVFKLNKDGSGYEVLRSFGSSGDDATGPHGGLLEGSDGVLYGTTYAGGSNNFGVVFRINKNGTDYGILRSFLASGGDGQRPQCSLVEDREGVLYGTTFAGGDNTRGTVFRINKNGTRYARVWSMRESDGMWPARGVIDGGDGLLYGTALMAGAANSGTLFCLYKDGSGYRVLKAFGGEGSGASPNELLQGSDGAIYGTTSAGGDMTGGTVFKLVPPPVGHFSGIARQGATNLTLNATGEVSFAYLLQATTNLLVPTSWKTIATNLTDSGGVFNYTDPAMGNYRQRFYRLRWP